jgi:flagellar basal-body rod modification protein FlgD
MSLQGINPMMSAPLQAQSASGSGSTNGSSSSTGSSASDLQSTFLNLLVTELQNQDPTSPVDPTQMVGQMVSLNQLDQLLLINEKLSNLTTTTSSGSSTTPSTNARVVNQGTPQMPTAQQAATAAANMAFPQNQANYSVAPGTTGLMNLYGSFGVPATTTNSNQIGAR